MSYQISEVIFDWLHRKRLISTVARHMGVVENTLIAKLRPTTQTAKLAADDLIPLFEAIRKAGYGNEFVGIVREYTRRLEGELRDIPGSLDMQSQIYRLMSGIGSIAEHLVDSARHSDEKEVVALLNKLRTEVLPVVMQLEATMADKLSQIRKLRRSSGEEPEGQYS
ncbi:MAG: hypothetical protein H6508_00040 [Calditrichaeota bacterium]|nr:hypothetical protein [Calditrichota bacterium]MCB9365561.1 hypothetical protein [Calditrichota bacterium]